MGTDEITLGGTGAVDREETHHKNPECEPTSPKARPRNTQLNKKNGPSTQTLLQCKSSSASAPGFQTRSPQLSVSSYFKSSLPAIWKTVSKGELRQKQSEKISKKQGE